MKITCPRCAAAFEVPDDANVAWWVCFNCEVMIDIPARQVTSMWFPIATAPHDREIVVYAPGREGLRPLVSFCRWHPDAGFSVDELREPEWWTELPAAYLQSSQPAAVAHPEEREDKS